MCYCGSSQNFEACCAPFIEGKTTPTSALLLMKSRYTAYCTGGIDYLIQTTARSEQKYYKRKDIENWSKQNDWLKLEIINYSTDEVEFKAYHKSKKGIKIEIHHEHSKFIQEDGRWKYLGHVE